LIVLSRASLFSSLAAKDLETLAVVLEARVLKPREERFGEVEGVGEIGLLAQTERTAMVVAVTAV
jgi:hypothetical protein